MPPRSRTKPGSTTRRPKVAGLRQHAHAGTATGGVDADPADTFEPVEAPDTVEAPVDDRGAVSEAPLPEAAAPGTAPDETVADETVPDETVPDETVPDETAPDETASPIGSGDGTVPADDVPTTGAAPTESATTESPTTASVSATAALPESERAHATDAGPATEAGTVLPTEPPSETLAETPTEAPTGTPGGAPAAADPSGSTTATTASGAPTRGRPRKRGGMTPRPEAADAPTRERPGHRGRTVDTGDDVTATPTRTAKPTRTGGATEPEAAPTTGRLASVRAGLARFGRSRALPIVLAAVVVVCLVLSGLAFWQGRQAWTSGPVSNQAVVDVSATAELVGQTREAVERIFSYDYSRLDESVDAARTLSTGQFTERYLSVFDQTIRAPAIEQQLRQTATAVNVGVISLRDDRAEVMVLAQFSAQRTSTGQSTNAPGLLRAEMLRVDGRWKLAELTPLTASPGVPR